MWKLTRFGFQGHFRTIDAAHDAAQLRDVFIEDLRDWRQSRYRKRLATGAGEGEAVAQKLLHPRVQPTPC